MAYQIIYQSMKKIQQKTETNLLYVLHQAIYGVTLNKTIKARCVSRSSHQVPIEIRSTQGKTLVIHWYIFKFIFAINIVGIIYLIHLFINILFLNLLLVFKYINN